MSWLSKQGIIIGAKDASKKDVIVMDIQNEYKQSNTNLLGRLGKGKKIKVRNL